MAKKKKYIVRHKVKEKEEIKKKELSMEEKFYWSKAITGLLSGIFGAWPIQLVGWWMFLYMMCFLFIFPFFLSFVIFRIPYKKGKWDWKNILKTGIGVNFFIFLFASTAIHTIIIYPEWEDQLHNPADTNNLFISDDIMYVADGSNGFLILNNSNINDRTLIGKFKMNEEALKVIVDNDTIYLSGEKNFYLINSSDLRQPEEINHYNTSEIILDFDVANKIAYLANGKEGLIILSTEGNTFERLGVFKLENATIQSVYIDNKIAFLGIKNQGIVILNVSQPSNPYIISQYELGGSPNAFYINGTVAFISASDQGIHFLNITNLYSPDLIRTLNTTGNSTDVIIEKNMLYISDNIEGIIRYELNSDLVPDPDFKIHQINGIAKKMFITQNYLYVSEGSKGITIIDLSDFGNQSEDETKKSISFGQGWIFFSFISVGLIVIGTKKKIKNL